MEHDDIQYIEKLILRWTI